jgi:hypothetical protein
MTTKTTGTLLMDKKVGIQPEEGLKKLTRKERWEAEKLVSKNPYITIKPNNKKGWTLKRRNRKNDKTEVNVANNESNGSKSVL